MSWKQVSDTLAVGPQITRSDILALKAAGFRSIVCHRPDGESADQPLFREIAEAAAKEGLEIRHQPVVAGRITPEDATRFIALLEELPAPTLAYCRSGARCTSLWSLGQARR